MQVQTSPANMSAAQTSLAEIHEPYSYLKQLNVVFKISERCNLACDYCYFFFAGDNSWKLHPATTKLSTLEKVAAFFHQMAVQHDLRRVIFILHGGEPLLVKKAQFRKMCDTLQSYQTENFRFQIAMQTNAALVDAEWIDIFSEYHIDVGVSLDGDKTINDLHRLDKKGRSSYDDTVHGLRLMQEAAKAGRMIAPGIICVIQPEADGTQTYHHFVHELGIDRVSFRTQDLAHGPELDKDKVDAINCFMLDAFHAWAKDNNGKIKIRQFSEPMRALLSDSYAELTAKFQEDYRNIISITSDGVLGPDDTLKTMAPRFREMGLDVFKHQPDELLHSQVWEELQDAAVKAPASCEPCKWWRMCKGGRLITRYSEYNDSLDNPSVYCDGLKALYSQMETALLQSGVQQTDIERRLGLAA